MAKLTVLTSSYNAKDYLKSYFKSAGAQTFTDFEIAFESIQPTPKEHIIIEKAKKKYKFINLKTHQVKIPLPQAWNSAIDRTKSELICIWNVDDLRTVHSLENMVQVFEKQKEIDFVYGNFTVVNKFKKTKGNYVNLSGKENGLRKSMLLGPFFMFRRSILDQIGYFDEQLLSGADYDFAMRLGRRCEGKHIDINLGYFLNKRSGLSTNENSLQEIERTVVEIRYDIDVLNNSLIDEAKTKYIISKYSYRGEDVNFGDFLG